MKSKSFLSAHPVIKQLLVMLAISVGILIVAFIAIHFVSRHGREYELPDLIGQNVDDVEAHNVLGLHCVILDSIYREGQEGGLIITQDPKPASIVKKGRKVYVTVTAYMPNDAIVPNIIGGFSLKDAISQLDGVGLRGGRLTFVENRELNYVDKITYRGMEIKAGQKLTHGAMVDLVVGLGNDPNRAVGVVPFVIGKKSDKARKEILSRSFNVGQEHFDGVSDRYSAVVYKQEPSYTGVSQYAYGTSVELWYCDADEQQAKKMVSDFKVDSSQIIQEETIEWGIEDADFESEGW
ncbi:MAG: PASTA domain-containing protein [Bacteroidales bacterium]|nr:PASTA domain-containing protein [Candidatus Colimorpha onthohippi]